MKPEDLIIASMIEAEASTTNVLQPDVDELVNSEAVKRSLNAAERYYGIAKEYLNDPTPEYEGRNPMESWTYEKGRYNNYNDFTIKATSLATNMSDNDYDIGVPLKNGMYDPQEFISWYEGQKADYGDHQEQF